MMSREMTNSEAISNLNHIYGIVSPDIQRSLDVAIKALEQQLKCGCNTCEYYPKGEWIKITRKGTLPVEYVCSCCGRKIYDNYERSIPMSEFYPFCHCGADMQKGGTDMRKGDTK